MIKLKNILSEAGMNVGHAEVRKLEKSLSSKNKELMVKAFDQGKIKTSKDLRNWVKSIGEGKLTESSYQWNKIRDKVRDSYKTTSRNTLHPSNTAQLLFRNFDKKIPLKFFQDFTKGYKDWAFSRTFSKKFSKVELTFGFFVFPSSTIFL